MIDFYDTLFYQQGGASKITHQLVVDEARFGGSVEDNRRFVH